jgi:hypothetical protein
MIDGGLMRDRQIRGAAQMRVGDEPCPQAVRGVRGALQPGAGDLGLDQVVDDSGCSECGRGRWPRLTLRRTRPSVMAACSSQTCRAVTGQCAAGPLRGHDELGLVTVLVGLGPGHG